MKAINKIVTILLALISLFVIPLTEPLKKSVVEVLTSHFQTWTIHFTCKTTSKTRSSPFEAARIHTFAKFIVLWKYPQDDETNDLRSRVSDR